MSPIDAARRMAEHPPTVLDSVTNRLHCGYCGQAIAVREDHAEDCPWLAQGQIVAALESAERIAAVEPVSMDRFENEGCCYCPWGPGDHEPDCPFLALVAALKGDA